MVGSRHARPEEGPLPLLGVVVSATGMTSSARARLEEALAAAGGRLSHTLEIGMHALIAERVGGDKYAAAKEWGMPVVRPAWISDSVAHGAALPTSGYELKPLTGLFVSVTGFGPGQRSALVEAISALGGRYTGTLERGVVSHLVAEQAAGAKVQAAQSWNAEAAAQNAGVLVHVVRSAWIEACRTADRLLPGEQFSWFATDKVDAARAEKLAAERAAARQQKTEDSRRRRAAELAEKQRAEMVRLEELAKLEAREASMYDDLRQKGALLDLCEGWIVYLHGFEARRWRVIMFLAQCAGATVYFEWNADVTHVIVGGRQNEDYIRELRNLKPTLIVLGTGPLLSAIEDNACPSRESLLALTQDKHDLARSTSTNGATGALREEGQHTLVRPSSGGSESSSATALGSGRSSSRVRSLLSRANSSSNSNSTSNDLSTHRSSAPNVGDTSSNSRVGAADGNVAMNIPLGVKRSSPSAGPTRSAQTETREDDGGMADFIQNLGNHRKSGVAKRARVRPQLVQQLADLTDALICVSGYLEPERSLTQRLAEELGANFTERFTKHDPKVTHLIAPNGESKKCRYARQWGVPIHTLEWLGEQATAYRRRRERSESSAPQAKP